MIRTLFVALFVAHAALAQGGVASSVASPDQNAIRATVSPDGGSLHYYVDTRGSDTNTCTAAYSDGGKNGPCATPNGARKKVARVLRHGGIVHVASMPDAGQANYPCYFISGFTCDVGEQQNNGGILFDGDLVLDLLTDGGTVTGTAQSGTAGASNFFGTLRDYSKQLVDNELRGRLITITGGDAGVGQVRVVSSNDAGELTIVGSWTAPNATSTYSIVRPGWNINTACANPITGGGQTANSAGVFVSGNTGCSYRASVIQIRNMGCSLSAGTCVSLFDGSSIQLSQSKISTTGNSGLSAIARSGSGGINTNDVSWTGSTSFAAVSLNTSATASLTRTLSYGSNGGLLSTGSGVQGPGVSVTSCETSNADTSGIFLGSSSAGRLLIQASVFDCAAGNPLRTGIHVGSNAIPSLTTLVFNNVAAQISQITIGSNCGRGVFVSGPLAFAEVDQMSGTPTTYALDAYSGGRIYIGTGGSFTMTGATADYHLEDGQTGTFASIGAATCVTSAQYASKICK